jgi:hypothetical protein
MSLLLTLRSNFPKSSTLADDFLDSSTDSSKWTVAPFWGSYTQAGTALEQNGRVEVASTTTASTANGYVSAQSYMLDSIFVSLGNTAAIRGTAQTGAYLAFGPNANNSYFVWALNGSLYLEKFVGGSRTFIGTAVAAYNSTSHRWIRLRWGGPTDDNVYVDTASVTASDPPAPGDWTQQYSNARDTAVNLSNGHAAFGMDAEGANNGTVYFQGFNTATGVPSVLTDNFDDNSRDTFKWTTGQLKAFNWNTSGYTVVEQNNRLEVTPVGSVAATASGYVSQNTYNMTGQAMFAKVGLASALPSGQEVYLSMGFDEADVYLALLSGGSLYIQENNNGSITSTSVVTTYSSTTHAWIRLRHNTSDDHIYLDTAPSSAANPPASGDWTAQGSVPRTISILAAKLALGCDTYAGVSAPVTAYFDGFNTATAGTQLASTLTDNFDDNTLDTTKWTSGIISTGSTTGATISEVNGRTEITPSSSASSYQGRTSVNSNYTLDLVYVALSNFASSGAEQSAFHSVRS